MKFNTTATMITATVWAAGIARPAEPASLLIRVHVYAEISPSALEQTKKTATSILDRTGVRTAWAECTTSEARQSKDAACDQPIRPLDLQIRIVDRAMAKRAPTRSSGCLGYAIHAGEFSSIASAFFHRAVELEGGKLADRGRILGAIVAHEIGHLMGVMRHSEVGLMRASWNDSDLNWIAKGWFWFTDEQALRIRTSVARRVIETEARISQQSQPGAPLASAPLPSLQTTPATSLARPYTPGS